MKLYLFSCDGCLVVPGCLSFASWLVADPIGRTVKAWAWQFAFWDRGFKSHQGNGCLFVCLLWVLCNVRERLLRRAYHSSRGVPRIVLHPLRVNAKPRNGRPWPGIVSKHYRKNKSNKLCFTDTRVHRLQATYCHNTLFLLMFRGPCIVSIFQYIYKNL